VAHHDPFVGKSRGNYFRARTFWGRLKKASMSARQIPWQLIRSTTARWPR